MESTGDPWPLSPTQPGQVTERAFKARSLPPRPHPPGDWTRTQSSFCGWNAPPGPSSEGTEVPTAGSALSCPLPPPHTSPAEKHISWARREGSCHPPAQPRSSPTVTAQATRGLPGNAGLAGRESSGPGAGTLHSPGEVQSCLSLCLLIGNVRLGSFVLKLQQPRWSRAPFQPRGWTTDAGSLQRTPNSGLSSSTSSLPQVPRGPVEPQPEECEPFPASPPLWPAQRGAGASGPL